MASKRTQLRKRREKRPTDARCTVGRFDVSEAFMTECKAFSATRRFTYYPMLTEAWVSAMTHERHMRVRSEREILGNGFIGPTRPTVVRLQAQASRDGVCTDGLVLKDYEETVHLRKGTGGRSFLRSKGLLNIRTIPNEGKHKCLGGCTHVGWSVVSTDRPTLYGSQFDLMLKCKASSPSKASEDYNPNHSSTMLVRTRKSRTLVQRPASGKIVELASSEEMDAVGIEYDSRAGKMRERIGILGERHIAHESERLTVGSMPKGRYQKTRRIERIGKRMIESYVTVHVDRPTVTDGSQARKDNLTLEARDRRKAQARRDAYLSDARKRYYTGRSQARLVARNKSLYADLKARHSSWFAFNPLFGPLF